MKQWDIEHKVGRNIMTHVTRGGEEAPTMIRLGAVRKRLECARIGGRVPHMEDW